MNLPDINWLSVLGFAVGFASGWGILKLVKWLFRYRLAHRVERVEAERILAYKALRGWGTYSDPEREAFVNGWLDQCFKPAASAFPANDGEAAMAAYQSGWVWSRERDRMMPGGKLVGDVADIFGGPPPPDFQVIERGVKFPFVPVADRVKPKDPS